MNTALLRLIQPLLSALSRRTGSVVVLVVANLVPLGGALFLSWPSAPILLGYAAEVAIAGVLTAVSVGMARGDGDSVGRRVGAGISMALSVGIFFAFHVFLLSELIIPAADRQGEGWRWFASSEFRITLASLAAGQLHLFVREYVLRGEYRFARRSSLERGFLARMMVIHLTVIAAALPLMMGFRAGPLLILIVLKTVADLLTFSRARNTQADGPAAIPPPLV